ncbi:peptidylprolyl isomerase [Desulfolutivibrio sp.]|uniref:peptidylprolyl isomerase n=1 Tax=Desulfolutivibrio sp. TaxID=2773296 RepID=UPI002F9624FF
MMLFSRYLLFPVLFLVMALFWGCDRKAEPPGVVATVNGRPVTLGQLEFNHDLRSMGLVATENPSVERLRLDYGRIMADLIIRELMLAELQKAGAAVTDEDLARLEAEIRADYPGELFDRMLFEENIDPQKWRESLLTRVATDKFAGVILKDRAKVEVQEAADYYKEHVADFQRPAVVTFLLVRGPDKKRVAEAVRERDSGRTFPREPIPDAASIQEVRLPRELIPEAWRALLGKLQPGQASPVVQEKREALALVLVGETPAFILDPAAAYPLVERALAEKKRNEAFSEWLAEAVAAADIRVSAHLVANGDMAVSEAPSPDILEKEFPGVGDGEGEHAAQLADTGQVSKSFADRFANRQDQDGVIPAPGGDGPAGPSSAASMPPAASPAEGDRQEAFRVVPGREGPGESTADLPPTSPVPADSPSGQSPAQPAAATPAAATPAAATPVPDVAAVESPQAGTSEPTSGTRKLLILAMFSFSLLINFANLKYLIS